MNKIWSVLVIIAIIFGLINNRIVEINNVIINVGEDTLNFVIPIIVTTSFWAGILNVARHNGVLAFLQKCLNPLLKFLFPDLKDEDEILQYIAANVVINMFGLGFAATPSGLKAMKLMQEKNLNKDTATRSMVTFLVLNTAGVTLVATNIIALRNKYGSVDATSFIPLAIIATFCASIAGLTLDRWWNYRKSK